MIGDELEERIRNYSNRCVSAAMNIPRGGRGAAHFADQLLRAATRARAAYSEARGAESPRDFIHKLSVSLKELRESIVWIDSCREAKMVREEEATYLLDEGDQLVRILFASRKTAKRNHEES